jgi:hypothetical protein
VYRRVVLLVALAGCAPATGGKVRTHIAAGYDKLAAKQFIDARKEFAAAEDALFDEPSDDAANAVHDGYARVDAGLIEAAVDTASKIRGDDAKQLEELHRLRLRLRTIGGNRELEAKITLAMNIRASLLITPHEAATTLTDLAPLHALGKYPELDESNRKRIETLTIKTWQKFRERAQAATPPLVRRTFEGLAAMWSGQSISDGSAIRDRELASFARGSKITVVPAGQKCTRPVATVLPRVEKTGAYQVDAEVTITNCSYSTNQTSQQVTEHYIDKIPYQAVETFEEQSCAKTQVPVYACVNPYVGNGCVSTGGTADSWACGTTSRTAMVTKYADVPKTREVTKTTTYETYGATLAVTLSYAGKREQKTIEVTTTLVDHLGEQLEYAAIKKLEETLEAPVKATIDARAAELRTHADAALAEGHRDEAELGYLRVVFLGRDAGDYFQRTYAVTPERLRAALESHASGNAVALAATESLPEITDERRDSAISFARDRFASTFPPALSRVRGFWYHAELGAVTIDDHGTSPAFALRFGGPVLARIHGRTRGFGAWDDLSVGGGLGYNATTGEGLERSKLWTAAGSYTAALGVRVPRFQLLAGPRGSALALKNGDTTGTSTGVSYWGNVAVQVGKPSLSLEVWYPTGYGDDVRGAQAYLAVKTPKAQYKNDQGITLPTSYLAFRAQEQRLDLLRVRDFMLLFGAGFN